MLPSRTVPRGTVPFRTTLPRVSLLRALVIALAAAALPAPAAAADDDEQLLDVAQRARPSVARVIWRDERYSDVTVPRNAIVIRADGLLLMAGPPPSRRGTLTVRFADHSETRAEMVAFDAETTLTLLRVARTGLPALALRIDPAPTAADEGPEKGEAPGKPKEAPKSAPAEPPVRRPRKPAQPRRGLPPLGLRVVMLTGDGSVAFGPIRAHGRHGTVTDPDTRKKVRTTGLLEALLAAVDADVGSPLLDARGRVAGLVVGRRSTLDRAGASAARRRGLTSRLRAVEAVAVPPRVVALVWPLLERHRRVPRAALGITTKPVDGALADQLRLTAGGHVIRRLTADGIADRHGLRRHDVIIRVGGAAIGRGTSLHDVLLPYRPGTKVLIDVVRAGRILALPVRLGER